ncbi:MAG: M3 family oligoendopeptidase [Ezakiella sp.]|nr:M3 family oligoendopeptidase [Bacillota bacterium]MDY3946462.1 M3 family oligoendopeptidase [Ezakiella sp.]
MDNNNLQDNVVFKFKDFEYKRPDIDEIKKVILEQREALINASSTDEAYDTYARISSSFDEFDSMATICSIRNSINTKDEFYEKEIEFLQENSPVLEEALVEYKKAFVESKFRSELEDRLGKYLFQKYENDLLTFKSEIMEDLIEESKLSTEYQKLSASCEIDWDGEKLNLTQIGKYTQDADRAVRERATKEVANFFNTNCDKYDEIYDKLVHVRDKMAKKLGYKNYVELGYKRMGRVDYDANDVKSYRDQIVEVVVPIATELRKRQAKRIGIEDMKFYDESLQFKSGNAKPHGGLEFCLNNAKKMYSELSPETDNFFSFMIERDLFDLESKPGKAGGGYCTYIPKYQSPFIFANFNGTTHDVEVLTHEAGHAFQVFNSRDYISEYIWPGMESAEIHSMSMEFFTWPWMNLFFENDEEKFKFSHLQGALLFLPYGALVDEFQHYVYENVDDTPEMRRAKYRELEKKYLPHRDYADIDFLDKGGFWFRQGHIFGSPFYYIDYTLAQVCAFQFWKKDRDDHKSAWESYLRLCKAGGTKPFLQLVELAGLENPFIDGTIKKTMEPIVEYLNSVDDSKFQ